MANRSLVRNRNLGTVHVPHQIITSMKFQYREKLKLQELRFHQIAGDFPIGFKTTKNRWLSRIIPKCSASKSKLHIQKNYPINNTNSLTERERLFVVLRRRRRRTSISVWKEILILKAHTHQHQNHHNNKVAFNGLVGNLFSVYFVFVAFDFYLWVCVWEMERDRERERENEQWESETQREKDIDKSK